MGWVEITGGGFVGEETLASRCCHHLKESNLPRPSIVNDTTVATPQGQGCLFTALHVHGSWLPRLAK